MLVKIAKLRSAEIEKVKKHNTHKIF